MRRKGFESGDGFASQTLSQSFDIENVNFLGQVLRPVGYQPCSEPFDLAFSTNMICLGAFAFGKWLLCQKIKNSQQFLPMTFGGGRKIFQYGVINAVAVRRHYRPSPGSRS